MSSEVSSEIKHNNPDTWWKRYEFTALVISLLLFIILPSNGLGIVLLWLASSIMSGLFESRQLERAILTFLLIPTLASALGLVLSVTGSFKPVAWLFLLCVVVFINIAITHWKSRVSNKSNGVNDDTCLSAPMCESVHWLEYLLTILCAFAGMGWSVFWNPLAMATHGHYWSINDGGWFVARQGSFPWLDPWRISHFNDHLYYNPAMIFLSAACHLFCYNDWQAARLVNFLPAVFVWATPPETSGRGGD